jgi:hypothetical protein
VGQRLVETAATRGTHPRILSHDGLMDPATALTFLNRSRAEPGYSEDSTSSLFEAWSSQAPMAAIDAAFQLTDPEMQDSALEAAIGLGRNETPWVRLVASHNYRTRRGGVRTTARSCENGQQKMQRRPPATLWAWRTNATEALHCET